MNNYQPRVSIGMPVYNGEKYLEAAIYSILAQTYSDFEFIISDNASTDRTPEICQAYAARDHRIRYFANEKNLGMAPNWNRVFALSSGEYFKWAAHDDVIAPTFLEKCVQVLDLNPSVVLCYSSARLIDENGSFLADYDPEPDLTSLESHQRFREFMLAHYYVVHLAGLLRADVVRKTPGLGSYPASDEVLLAELSLYGKFHVIPERLFSFRRHPGQSTLGALIPNPQGQGQFKQRDRILIFDTSYAGKIVLSHWLYFADALRAVRQAPLSKYPRVYCYVQMLHWLLVPSHFRAMGKDVLLAIKQLIVRTRATASSKDHVLAH